MNLSDIKNLIPSEFYHILEKQNLEKLRPCQEKAIEKGLLQNKNIVICTPTASGKTLCAELAAISNILNEKGKAIYIVPLKALATEKYKSFQKLYNSIINIGISIGDYDDSDQTLYDKDIIIATAEKMDSLIRHNSNWINNIKTIIIDETHLLNDQSRGPTLEIIITMLRQLLKDVQIIALSATIGNPETLASWLNAELVIDKWRPVKLRQGICIDENIEFY